MGWLFRIAVLLAAGVGLSAPVSAQTAASAYTTGYRYDGAHHLTGTISPSASGTSGPFVAVRNTYDAAGRLVEVETGSLSVWKADTIAPASWGTSFTVGKVAKTSYDAQSRKVKETMGSGPTGATLYAVTQYSYDSYGRLECTAVRMGSASQLASIDSANPNACTASSRSYGDDRITRNTYDAAGQLLVVEKAYGTSLVQNYATYTYSANGKQTSVKDANGNLATMTYDGFDRETRWTFPSKTSVGAVDAIDYEQYGYDANGNRTSLRKRDGSTIAYTYDNLNRVTLENVPTGSDVYYGYDLQGHQLYARFGSSAGAGITNVYDGFGQLTSTSSNQSGTAKAIGHLYDADGNRIRVTHPDGTYFAYAYDNLDRLVSIKQSGTTVIASVTYNPQGTVATLTRGAVTTTYGYDPVERLASIADNLASTTNDVTSTFAYNPANQIVTRTRSNDGYAFDGYVNVNRAYAKNGLNQYTTAGSATFTYDANGNLTSDGTFTYTYDVENRLLTAKQGTTTVAGLTYDPLGRLYQTSGAATTRFLYDGDELVEEYNTSGTVLRRYVHGTQEDDPLIWYEGAGLTDRRSLEDDHQGSIVSVADASGTLVAIDGYDEYGIPGATNTGRFQYTGQAWIPELGMYYYKARIYSPSLGRFLQTDPIGYKDQVNLYAYVGNDPVNFVDPTGLCAGWVDASGYAVRKPGDCIVMGNPAASGFNWGDFLTFVFGRGGITGYYGDLASTHGGYTSTPTPPPAQETNEKPPQSYTCPVHISNPTDPTAALVTVGGLIAGVVDVVASRLSGGGGSVSYGNNAVQFTGGSFGQTGRAVTLGYVTIYGPGSAPDAPLARYDGQPTNALVGDHERQHTYQWQEGAFFLGQYVADLLTVGQSNARAEKAADNGADAGC